MGSLGSKKPSTETLDTSRTNTVLPGIETLNEVDSQDAYAAYEQGLPDLDVGAYFVDDNPLSKKGSKSNANENEGKNKFAEFSGELGERLNFLVSDSFDDLSGARLKLRLMELYKRNKPVDTSTLDPSDAAWYSEYVEQQMAVVVAASSVPPDDSHQDEIAAANDNEQDLKALLQRTRAQLAEYQAKVASMEAEKKHGEDDEENSSSGRRKGTVQSARASGGQLAACTEFDVSIHEATLNQDEELIEDILTTFPKAVRSVDNEGRSALHLASKVGYVRIVKLLLDYGALVNAQDAEGQTALHLAADAKTVRMLCAQGARTDTQDNHGFNPLHFHIMMIRADVVDALMAHSADPRIREPSRSRNALHLAADTGNFAIFSTVVTESQVLLPLDDQDKDGNAALHLLASNRQERLIGIGPNLPPSVSLQKCLMMLLDRGAAVNLRNHRGSTPLHYLCSNRSLRASSAVPPFVDILLEMGADPNMKDCEDCTPLMVCAVHGDWESCTLLISRGADMNIPCLMTSHHLIDPASCIVESKEVQNTLPKMKFTPMDLFPKSEKELQRKLFTAVAVRQTKVHPRRRSQCMECGCQFRNPCEFEEEEEEDKAPSVVDSILGFFTRGAPPSPEMLKMSSYLKSAAKVAGQEVKKLAVVASTAAASSSSSSSGGAAGPPTPTTGEDAAASADVVEMSNCEHCGRLLCHACLPGRLLTALVPPFIRPLAAEAGGADSVALCGMCTEVLVKPENIPAHF